MTYKAWTKQTKGTKHNRNVTLTYGVPQILTVFSLTRLLCVGDVKKESRHLDQSAVRQGRGRLKMFLNLKHILPCLCCFIKHCYLQYTAWFLIIFLGDNSFGGPVLPRPPRDFRLWLLEQQISILAWFLKDHITGAIISHSVFPRCSSSSVRTLTSIPVMLLFSIKSMWNF